MNEPNGFNGAETQIGMAMSNDPEASARRIGVTTMSEDIPAPDGRQDWVREQFVLRADTWLNHHELLVSTTGGEARTQVRMSLGQMLESSFDSGMRAAKQVVEEQETHFEDMFPDPDSEKSLKERIEELEEMLTERDQEEITRRQSISVLQQEVKQLEEIRAELVETINEKDIRIEELDAFIDAKDATINRWCDRAESFGVDNLEDLMKVAQDYRQSVTMLGGAIGGLYPAISELKMKLVEVLTGRSEVHAKRVREAAAAFRHASRPELDGRTTSGRLHQMDETGRALDYLLDDAAP